MATTWIPVETAPLADHETVRLEPPFGHMARRLQLSGFTAAEVGNFTARFAGLAGARSGWSVREVQHLVFLRTIVETGRLGH